jgi:hypothetical protein
MAKTIKIEAENAFCCSKIEQMHNPGALFVEKVISAFNEKALSAKYCRKCPFQPTLKMAKRAL